MRCLLLVLSPPDGLIRRERFRRFHPKAGMGEPMAMLPTLSTQKTIMVNQMCRHILPGNVAETCFPVQERNEGNFSYNCSCCRSAQSRSWPSLSAPYFSFLAACTSAVWSWPALPKLYQIGRSFSFQIWGSPMTFRKNKRRITM